MQEIQTEQTVFLSAFAKLVGTNMEAVIIQAGQCIKAATLFIFQQTLLQQLVFFFQIGDTARK